MRSATVRASGVPRRSRSLPGHRAFPVQVGLLAAAVLFGGACSDGLPTSPLPPQFTHSSVDPANPDAFVEEAWVCKAGVGSGTFVATGNLPGSLGAPAAGAEFTVNAGECVQISDIGGPVANVTVTETATSPGTQLASVDIIQRTGGVTGPINTTNVPGPSATGSVGGNVGGAPETAHGVTFVFYNEDVPVFLGNSINVQRVRIAPAFDAGSVSSFTGSFEITAFDKAVTVTGFAFRISRNGDAYFWQGSCTTVPGTPLNVGKSSTVIVTITPSCLVGPGPVFKKGDDVRLEVIATLATGRVFSNSGFYKVP